MAKREQISIETIEKWLNYGNSHLRRVAMNVCIGRQDVPIEILEKGLNDLDVDVKQAAMKSCECLQDIPVELIWKMLNSNYSCVRKSAMENCIGREDIPVETIERFLYDSRFGVRVAALKVMKSRGIEIPVSRTFEPPELVYKKCLGDVIVLAKIPKDAHVRGDFGRKCRASKAVIVDVIGELCGEKVGISKYDDKTTYYKGDKVEIDDFDMSEEECSTGFHFFCTKEEAEMY